VSSTHSFRKGPASPKSGTTLKKEKRESFLKRGKLSYHTAVFLAEEKNSIEKNGKNVLQEEESRKKRPIF